MIALAACNRRSPQAVTEGYREFAYIANSAGNSVTVVDLVYLRVDRTLSVGAMPVALEVNPMRNEVYVLNAQPSESSGSVSVIDTEQDAVVAVLPAGRNPRFLSVDATGQRGFVIDTGSNEITVLDLPGRKVIGSFPAGDHPGMAALSEDGHTLVVTNTGDGSVSVFGTNIPVEAKLRAVPAKAAPPGPALLFRALFLGCPGATSPVILPDSSKAFVACSGSRRVMVIALAVSAPRPRDATNSADHELAMLDVGENPTNLTLKPDGGEIFVSNRDSDSVSEILTYSDEVGSTYAIGNKPAHGLVSGDNSLLWVSNLGAQAISLYSIADGKFLSSLRAGMAPDALAFSADEHFLLAADTLSGDVAVIRTDGKLGPSLYAILPAGGSPVAIAVKAMPPHP